MTENTHVDDPQVAAILAAAAAPAEAPLPGESEALAAFCNVHHPHRRLHLMSRKSENAKLVAAAVFGGLVVLSGAAAAATGALPLGHTNNGHNHPTPAASHTPDANDQGDNDSQDATDTADTTSGSVSTLDQNQGKGSEISTLAHSVTGGHKGKTICIVASAGHCHAAQPSAAPHGQSALPHGKAHQNGQSGATTHGQSGATTHGQSGATTHGQSGATTHGQSGATTHGQSGATTHGNSSQAHS